MIRKFTKEQKERLRKAWQAREELTIEGVNALGDKFVTTGRVSTTDDGKARISDHISQKGVEYNGLFLEFGLLRRDGNSQQTLWSAPYELNIEEGEFASGFTIKTIKDKDGNVIFEQENFNEVELVCAKNKVAEMNMNKNRQIKVEDPITKACRENIGKPVIIMDLNDTKREPTYGIVERVTHVADYGDPIIELASGTGLTNDYSGWDKAVVSPQNDGNFPTIADSCGKETEYRKMFLKNLPTKSDTENE